MSAPLLPPQRDSHSGTLDDTSMERFAERLESELTALADGFELPGPDFQDRLRQRIAQHRRRRRTTVAAAVATYAAAVLAGALTLAVPGLGTRAVDPATGSTVTAPADPASGTAPAPAPGADTPWWASGPTDPSGVLNAFWDSQGGGPHDQVKVLDAELVSDRVLMVVTGRQQNGQWRILLVLGDRGAPQDLSDAPLSFLSDLPAPPAPGAPIAVTVTDTVNTGTSMLTVLAPPCAGERLIGTQGGAALPAQYGWTQAAARVWRTSQPLGNTAQLSLSCPAGGGRPSYQLVPAGPAVSTAGRLVTLLVGV